MLYENIKKLVEYGIQTGLTPDCERIYSTNLLLELFQEDSYEDVEIDSSSIELEAVLEGDISACDAFCYDQFSA